MPAAALLVRGHLRARWRRQAALAGALAIGLFGFLAVSMVLAGAEEGVVRPLRDFLVGDARITWGGTEVAGGEPIADYRKAGVSGAFVAPRWESSQVSARTDAPGNWTGGLLVGLDPSIPQEAQASAPYLVWGRSLQAQSLADPATGRVYAQLLVGEVAARRLNLTLGDGPDFQQVVSVTSGRFREGSTLPITMQAVVVGVFSTGIDSLDRFTAYTDIRDVRQLVGDRPGDPSANALVVWGGPVVPAGAMVQDANAFARDAMGAFLLMLDVAGALAILLVLAVLGTWLAHSLASAVTQDRLVVASLRAVGIPFRSIASAYGVLAGLTVAAALLVAIAAAVALWALGPPLAVAANKLELTIPWTLEVGPVVAAGVASVLLAAVGTGWAARRVGAVDVAEALRP